MNRAKTILGIKSELVFLKGNNLEEHFEEHIRFIIIHRFKLEVLILIYMQ